MNSQNFKQEIQKISLFQNLIGSIVIFYALFVISYLFYEYIYLCPIEFIKDDLLELVVCFVVISIFAIGFFRNRDKLNSINFIKFLFVHIILGFLLKLNYIYDGTYNIFLNPYCNRIFTLFFIALFVSLFSIKFILDSYKEQKIAEENFILESENQNSFFYYLNKMSNYIGNFFYYLVLIFIFVIILVVMLEYFNIIK